MTQMEFIYSFYIGQLILLFILFCLYWIQLLIPVNAGDDHWLMAKVELTLRSIRLYDSWEQEVEYQVRNQQVACLRWFLPSMLNQIGFQNFVRKSMSPRTP